MILWVLLAACVALCDVVGLASTAAVPKLHRRPRPHWLLEEDVQHGGVEPRGRPRDPDDGQREWRPPQMRTHPDPPAVDSEREVPSGVQLWKPTFNPNMAVKCGKNMVRIEVSQDLWGNGHLIHPEELTLGPCSYLDFDSMAHVLSFESELHKCGSKYSTADNYLIYRFVLQYRPKPPARIPITRTQDVDITVECLYSGFAPSWEATQ